MVKPYVVFISKDIPKKIIFALDRSYTVISDIAEVDLNISLYDLVQIEVFNGYP